MQFGVLAGSFKEEAGTRKNAAASSVLIATSAKEARQTLRRRRRKGKMTFPFLLQSTLSEKMVSFYFYLNLASKSRRQWRPIWLWTWQTGRQCISGISNKAEQTTRRKRKKEISVGWKQQQNMRIQYWTYCVCVAVWPVITNHKGLKEQSTNTNRPCRLTGQNCINSPKWVVHAS